MDIEIEDAFYDVLHISEAAANGKIGELERLYKEDRSRLHLTDSKGRTVLHHAAKTGQTATINFIVDRNSAERLIKKRSVAIQEKTGGLLKRFSKASTPTADFLSCLDVADQDGCTCLHVAVENNRSEAVKLLLEDGASTELLTGDGFAPIHLAVKCNHKESLLVLCKHPYLDINLGADKGVTAMHCAAYYDRPECAKILLEHGAKLCKPCEVGMLPIHVATLHGAADTLEAIMQFAEKAGYTRDQVLRLRDSSQNMPLHMAVSGGDIRAVVMCLAAGAQISGTQSDNSTPIHMAAQQGELEMIKAMFEAQPENRDVCIQAKDTTGMTPLHKAAVFDRANVAKYLIEQGAKMNDLDGDGMSPLLLSAAKKAWDTVEVLLVSKSDVTIRDKKNRNILHLIIRNGGKPEEFSFCMCGKNFSTLANERDEHGCTPLHYASKEGHLKTVVSLLDLGATLNVKNNNRESPLHFAAGHGRINTCRRLLDSTSGKNTINETNGDGQTPLHAAAMRGHTKVVDLLLHMGASTLRDRLGKTAIHLAAEEGYVNTVKTILNVHPHLLNSSTKGGDTCLHLAARNGQTAVVTLLMSSGAAFERNFTNEHFVDVAMSNQQKDVLVTIISHDRWDEALAYRSDLYGCPMIGLIKLAPEICQMVLDRCRTPSKDDPACGEFSYTYDFRFLDLDAGTVEKLRSAKINYTPLYSMNVMVEYNRVNCLSHPVCLAFLKMKWRTYGMWFWAINLFIYVAFLASLTAFITNFHHGIIASTPSTNTSDTSSTPHWSTVNVAYADLSLLQLITIFIILVFCILNMVKEIVQMFQQRLKYFVDLNNYLEWTLYITSTILVAPFLVGISSPIQWQCGAIAVFLAWFNLLIFLQRFDLYGIYVVMFLEILRTLLQVLGVFSILIIAFALSFYTLMYTDESNQFVTPQMSLMTITMMMLSNIEYLDSWVTPHTDGDPNTLFFSGLSFFMLGIFIILMPILLMNLLIGLAVGDIEAIQKNATLKRLAMTVELHTDIERKLPARLLKYVHKATWEVHPNCPQYYVLRLFKKITSTNDEDYSTRDDCSNQDTALYQELYNQKQRLKSIQSHLNRQYDLLRLVVQKMEIRSEAEDQEEADNLHDNVVYHPADKQSLPGVGWTNPGLRNTLMKQASVLAKWGKSMDHSAND